MCKYVINGGIRLSGEVAVSGSKNAILPILAATVLNGKKNIIENCPDLLDTVASENILKSIGCLVYREDSTLIVDSSTVNSHEIKEHLTREMRSSIIFLGSVIARFHKAKISFPGGCALGPRPIDFHINALKQLGVSITEEKGYLICETKGIKGTKISLDYPSVGATENIMLASVFAKGATTIINAAKEPEIVDLQNFLNSMGADITGAGTDTVVIKGVTELNEVRHKVMPDRIAAGTFLTAAAITGGSVKVNGVSPAYMQPLIAKLKETGCRVTEELSSITLKSPPALRPVDILRTHPHPGFPTDCQPQFMSVLTLAQGTSIIIETVFESRFKHAAELNKMGANISTEGRAAIIKGVNELSGSVVKAMDLRGGAALILAGLAARGETQVLEGSYVKRGYENIEESLASLGADIKCIN
jgi:UDP-N-acetylglucosamine 1-carboxyvinyltransferase